MDQDKKRKKDLAEAATGPDWREGMHSSARIRSSAIILDALYNNNSIKKFPIDEVITIASKIELQFYESSDSEDDYLWMINDYQRKLGTGETATDRGPMPAQHNQKNIGQNLEMPKSSLTPVLQQKKRKATDTVENVLTRHRETTDYYKNLLVLFNMWHAKQQRLAVHLHQLRASIEFSNSLDEVTEHLESLQNLPEMNPLSKCVEIYVIDDVYESMVHESVVNFVKHIKNLCDCPRGVTMDVNHGSATVDLNIQRPQDEAQRKIYPDSSEMLEPQSPADHRSDATKTTIVHPQQQLEHQQKPSVSNEDQTASSLDDDLLAEYQAFINVPDKEKQVNEVDGLFSLMRKV